MALDSCPVKCGPAVRMGSGPWTGKLWILCSVGVGCAVDLELTHGSGDTGCTLRAVLQLMAWWGCCEEEERLPTAAASLRGKQEENKKC